jgi:L-threonylcarbamoyladenylate synthase
MTGPLVDGAGSTQTHEALREGRLIVVPGVGGYQLATRHGGPGVSALVALADARAPDAVPYFAVGRMGQAARLTGDWSDAIRRLAVRFWPGPLIMIVGDGDESVRLTMPSIRAVRALCRSCGPLVMVAARGAEGQPLVDLDGVRSAFDAPEVALVVNGGTQSGPGPSVLDCRVTPPAVSEEGALPRHFIEAALIMSGRRRRMSRS